MALNTKKFLVLDPVVWPVLPPWPGLNGMLPHQAKEGALLMLEAGAPAFPALVRIAETSLPRAFGMEDAHGLSEVRATELDKARAEKSNKGQAPRGEMAVIDAVPKEDERERKRIAGLKEFPVKAHHTIAGNILTAMSGTDGPVQFTKAFFAHHRIFRPINQVMTAALRLQDAGVLRRLTIGHRGEPSRWELTDLGRANAQALKGGSDAEKA